MANKIFKCYSELDTPENMFFLGINQVKKITPVVMHDSRTKLFVDYYDDEFCFDTVLVCEKIVTIDIDTDEDYKIWRNS